MSKRILKIKSNSTSAIIKCISEGNYPQLWQFFESPSLLPIIDNKQTEGEICHSICVIMAVAFALMIFQRPMTVQEMSVVVI